jgi:hypothetical protein
MAELYSPDSNGKQFLQKHYILLKGKSDLRSSFALLQNFVFGEILGMYGWTKL